MITVSYRKNPPVTADDRRAIKAHAAGLMRKQRGAAQRETSVAVRQATGYVTGFMDGPGKTRAYVAAYCRNRHLMEVGVEFMAKQNLGDDTVDAIDLVDVQARIRELESV